MDYLIFGLVLLHLVVGFGWLLYKLEIQKKTKDENREETNSRK